MTKVIDGIYETCPTHGPSGWRENRRVYIQNDVVRLIDYRPYNLTDEEYAKYKLVRSNFGLAFFFAVNVLGPRVGDLPENFNICEE